MTPKKVKAIRVKLGLTQTQFAKQLNYERSTISKWESGAIKLGPRAEKAIGDLATDGKVLILNWNVFKGENQ